VDIPKNTIHGFVNSINDALSDENVYLSSLSTWGYPFLSLCSSIAKEWIDQVLSKW